MPMCPKADMMERGLLSIIDELLGEIWVECGVDVPSLRMWEQTKCIEVIPISREEQKFQIDMVIGKKQLSFKWDYSRMVTESNGIYEFTFGNCNQDELAIAGGLMLKYYGHAMADQ